MQLQGSQLLVPGQFWFLRPPKLDAPHGSFLKGFAARLGDTLVTQPVWLVLP